MSRREDAQGEGPLDDAAVAERWAELTAALGDLELPDGEDFPAAPPAGTTGPGAPARQAWPETDEHPHPPGPRDYIAAEEDEGFVPPEPEPLGTGDPVVTLGWVAAVGPVLLALVLAVVWSPVPGWLFLALGVTVLAGVALLLWRMPGGRAGGTRGDGAVI